MTDRLEEIEANIPCGFGSYGDVCTADNLCTYCKDAAYLLSLLKRRAEGDGAEIVRELRKAAYDKADLHNSTAPYGMDDMHPTDTLYSRAADYIEAMGGVPAGWVLVPVEPTPEMKIAGAHVHDQRPSEVAAIYAAMLAASPVPPAAANGAN